MVADPSPSSTVPSNGSLRRALAQALRIAGAAWAALVLVASALVAIGLVRGIRRDPDLPAFAIVALAAATVAIAIVATLAVVELARRGRVTAALAISLAVLAASRVLAILAIPTSLRTDWGSYHGLGIAIANGDSIDTPRSIGWPALLGLLYRIGGPDPVLGELANLAVMLITAVILFWLTRRSFGAPAAAAATFLYAASPAPAVFVVILASEPLFAMLLTLAVAVAVIAIERGWWAWLATGAVLGAAQYVRPAGLILAPAFVALPFLTLTSIRRAIVAATLVALCFVVVLIPNVVDQYGRTGRLTLSTSNYDGWNLLVGLNERSGGRYNGDDLALLADVPVTSARFVSESYRLAFERFRADPLVVARLAPTKFRTMWGDATYAARFAYPDNEPARPERAFLALAAQGMHIVILGLFMLGLVLRRSIPPVTILITACLAAATLAAIVLEVQPRYHAPFEPLLCVLAGSAVATLWGRLMTRRAAPATTTTAAGT